MRKFYAATKSFKKVALLFSIEGIIAFGKSFLSRKIVALLTGCLFLTGFAIQSSAQTIGNVAISPNSVCAGTAVTITFDVTNGGAGNHFTNSSLYQAYLSDNTGNNFAAIGSTFSVSVTYSTTDNISTAGLTQSIPIPAGTPTGGGYKISIGATTPTFNGSNGANASSAFTINAQIVPTVSVSTNTGTTICAGTSVTFTANIINGGASPAYQWRLNGLNISLATGSTYITSTLTNGNIISVALTSNATPCLTVSSVTSTGVTMTVNPNLPVSVSVGASATTVCAGTSVTFTATPT
ncbi:hypothetical protein, partial [Ferruginibacter sp.]|uniref:hypothetical protein n=2 Tax=Ferruginibacter sp. TaxID=1940288 RepID=UPI00265B344C